MRPATDENPRDAAWYSYIVCVWVGTPVVIVAGVIDILTP